MAEEQIIPDVSEKPISARPRRVRKPNPKSWRQQSQEIQLALSGAGINADLLAQKLREGLEAMRTWRVLRPGRGRLPDVVEKTEPDYFIRYKYLETIARMLRAFPSADEAPQAAILVLKLPQEKPTIEEWNRTIDAELAAAKAKTQKLLAESNIQEPSTPLDAPKKS